MHIEKVWGKDLSTLEPNEPYFSMSIFRTLLQDISGTFDILVLFDLPVANATLWKKWGVSKEE